MTLRLRVPKYHCQGCRRYFRHPFVGIRPRYRASEAYQLEVYEATAPLSCITRSAARKPLTGTGKDTDELDGAYPGHVAL